MNETYTMNYVDVNNDKNRVEKMRRKIEQAIHLLLEIENEL
jgi:hypothetical protein